MGALGPGRSRSFPRRTVSCWGISVAGRGLAPPPASGPLAAAFTGSVMHTRTDSGSRFQASMTAVRSGGEAVLSRLEACGVLWEVGR